jgi:hypothetical protein
MLHDLHPPIEAICPGCGEPSRDLLAHAPHCSTPEAFDLRARFEEASLEIKTAIEEIEFALTTVAPEEAASYASRLAELHAELQRRSAPTTSYRQLICVLRERHLLLEG